MVRVDGLWANFLFNGAAERMLQILGGQFALTTAPDQGTLVEVEVPAGIIRERQ